MTPRYSYATLEQARQELRAEDGDISNDPQLLGYLLAATARIEQEKGHPFAPLADWHNGSDTWFTDVRGPFLDNYSGQLMLPAPALQLTAVTETDGTALVAWDGTRAGLATCDVAPMPLSGGPIYGLQRMDGTGYPSRWGLTSGRFISVQAIWGYHSQYSAAWVSSGDTLQANAGTSDTQWLVGDTAGVDSEGCAPRFSAAQIIRCGSEIAIVTDAQNGVLTVTRGQLGTTAASHDADAPISVWRPEPNIVRATIRLAAYLHKKRSRFDNYVIDPATGAVTRFSQDIPDEVKAILAGFPNYGARVMARGI